MTTPRQHPDDKTEQSLTDELSSQTPYKRAQAIAEMLHETPPLSQTHHALVQALGEELAELDSLRAMTCGLGDELAELDTLRAQLAEAQDALQAAQRLLKEALPKFNWGASFLDADAIQLLNEVPAKVDAAIATCLQTLVVTTPPRKSNES